MFETLAKKFGTILEKHCYGVMGDFRFGTKLGTVLDPYRQVWARSNP
tara:strand:- start:118 stop:258 length:141 start_codon:yes stop_codon:yes gene_type:complete